MLDSGNKIEIHTRIHITADALQTIVANAKRQIGTDAGGIYRIDTAEVVNRLITSFLEEKDFDAYVRDMENYGNIPGISK